MNQDNNKDDEGEKYRCALAPISRLRAPATFARSPPIINPSLPTLLALSLSLPTSLPPSLPPSPLARWISHPFFLSLYLYAGPRKKINARIPPVRPALRPPGQVHEPGQ